MYNITLDRYYNRSGEVSHSDYKTVLFRAGDALQSAEMNEAQSLAKNSLTNFSSKFITNGDVVSGIEINTSVALNGNSLNDVTVTSTEGMIFVGGEFIEVLASTITKIDQDLATSSFGIGAQIVYEEVTHNEDDTLLDPALETRNQGQPGAARLKITASIIDEDSFVAGNDREYLPLHTISGGELDKPNEVIPADPFDKFRGDTTDIVAKYDRNSNGNYLLEGHEIDFTSTDNPFTGVPGTNVGPFWFNVADGSSNVDGYNFDIPHSRKFELNTLVDYELKQNEPQEFIGSGWYSLRHVPIRKVFRVSGQKTNVEYAMVHGSFSGSNDEIPEQFQPVLSLVEIKQGAYIFTQGTDYSLVGDTIYWLSGGNEPAPSSTYHVTFTYQYTETEGAFTSDGNYLNGTISPDAKSIYLHGFSVGSQIQYDYDFILDRIDTVFIDSRGNIGHIKGIAAEKSPKAPENDTEQTLKIAEIKLSGDAEPVVKLTSNRTFKMSDIQLILDSVRDNDYNLGRLSLEVDLVRKQPGALLKGQFIDAFNDDDYRDEGLENDAMAVGNNLILDMDWLTVNYEPLTALTEEQEYYEMASVPNPTAILVQPHYTKTRKVNSYLFTAPPPAKLTITPSVYRWLSKVEYKNLNIFRRHQTLRIDTHLTVYNWRGINSTGFQINDYTNDFKTRHQTNRISVGRSPAIIPQIPIRVTSNTAAFNAGEQVSVTLDNVPCGSLTADSNGKINGSVVVPPRSVSGAKELVTVGDDSGVYGSTIFHAVPLTRTITNIVVRHFRRIVRKVWYRYVNLRPVRRDPVAQTFTLRDDVALDKIEVVFDVKSQTDVTCTICETTAGMPDKDKTMVSKTVKVANLVNAGSRQSFTFENKVHLTGMKEYAFVIINDDPVAELQVAELGKRTIDVPNIWLTNPAYQTGVLLSSANNSTWTPHQTEDVRFWLYDCTFGSMDAFNYDTKNVTDMTDFMVLADATVNEGTSIQYKVEFLDRTGNLPSVYFVDANDQIPTTERYSGRIKISAEMESAGLKSPIMDADIQLAVGTSKKTSTYTSKGIEIDYQDSSATAYIDCYEPSNTNILLEMQIVDPVTKIVSWKPMMRSSEVTELGREWKELKFTFNLQDGGHVIDADQTQTRVRIKLATGDDSNRPVISDLRFNIVEI